MELHELTVFLVAVAVQMAGLASVLIARFSQKANQDRYRRFFLVCLGLVGVISMLSLFGDSPFWIMPASTLPLMALGVTFDLGTPIQAEF